MEESIRFISNITQQQLQEINNELFDPEQLKKFINQLMNDSNKCITGNTYDILQRAENHIAAVAKLENNDPYRQESSLEKLDILNKYLGNYNNPDDEQLENNAHQSAAILLEMYQALNTVLITSKIKNILINYKNHLEHALRAEGIGIGINSTLVTSDDEKKLPTEVQYLIRRYTIISNLYLNIQNEVALNGEMLDKTQQELIKCIKLKPLWSEKPFFEQLKEVLGSFFTVGMTLLYKNFNSPEAKASKEMRTHFPGSKL